MLIAVFFALLIVGCADNDNVENQSDTNNYHEVKEVAWDFLKDKGWDDTVKGNWQSAKVTKGIVDNNFELLDNTYEGKEALSVSFEDKENIVVGTPLILVDINTNKVIGYMPSE